MTAMGADRKRKEARKRKFGGGQNCEYLIDTGSQLDMEGTSSDLLNRNLKQACLPRSSKYPFAAEGNVAGKSTVLDKSKNREEESTPQKSQRFIVFIGSSTLTKNFLLSPLTARFTHRQSPLHCNG